MKKFYLFTALTVLFVNILIDRSFAVPAYPYPVQITQRDGTVLSVILQGDERIKWAITPDEYALIYNSKGVYEYAKLDASGDMIPSGVKARNVSDRSSQDKVFLNSVRKNLIFSPYQVSAMKQIGAVSVSGAPEKAFPTSGSHKLICILIGYTDKPFTKTQTDFQNLFNQVGYSTDGATGSVKDFFSESSYNQFNLTVDVAGPFTASNTMAYYGGNDTSGNDLRPRELVTEAVKLADPTVNFADYDNDGDGNVDGVYVIFAGYGEETGASADCIWSHAWSIPAITCDGKVVSRYSCSPELRANSGTGLARIGVICHEFGHILGAPDFYDTNYATNGQYLGTGNWDLQASGSWNGDWGATPAQSNPYTKIYIYNWATATTLSNQANITLQPAGFYSNSFYRFNTATTNEFYLLENRQQQGFDAYVPGHGLVIFHVSKDIGNGNINITHPQLMYPVCASATSEPNSTPSSYGAINSGSCPFPGTSNITSFSDFTIPSEKSWAGVVSGKPISNITENISDHTISLCFMGCSSIPMSYISSTTVQNNTSNALRDQINQEVIGIQIVTNGGLTPLSASSFTFNTSGSTNPVTDISNAKLFYTGTGGTFESATQFGTTSVSPNGSFTITGNQELNDGTNYFWLTYDVPATAVLGNSLDAQCTELVVGTVQTPTVTDPVGNRQLAINYCAAGSSNTSYEYISKVSIGTISQSSLVGLAGYQDFTTQATTMQIGTNYSATITVGNPYSSDQILIWVDWNNNGNFTDPGENVYASSGTFVNPTTSTNFTPPVGAVIGKTRMRIRLQDAGTPPTNATPCGNSSYGEVEDYTVNVIPGCVAPSAPGVGTITQASCTLATGSVVLNGLPATGTWTLTRIQGAISTTGTGITSTINGLAAGTYTFTVTDATGCTSAASANVVINTQPTTPSAPTGTAAQSFCPGATVASLVASGTAINWYAGNSGGTALDPATVLVTGTHYYASQTITPCESATRLDVTVTILTAPTAPTVGTITQPTCSLATGSVILSGLPATGTWTVTRTPGATVTTSTGTTSTITGIPAGTYTYTVKNSAGCTSVASANVVINAQPATPAAPTGVASQSFCPGSTVAALVATGTAIKWYSAASGGTALATTTILVNGTHYYATQTVTCESTARLNITVTVLVLPIAPTVGTITQPTCALATGSVILNGLPSTGTWTLTRSPGAVTSTGTGASSTITGLASGTYTYKVTNASGCVSSASANVVVSAQPVQTAPTIGTITQPTCAVATGSVILSGLPSSGTWTLTRTPGATVTTGTGTTSSITGLATGTYTYTVKNTSGCTSVASANVVINTQPSPPAAPTGTAAQSFCSGATVASLTATGTSLKWYAAATGGTVLSTTTILVNGTHYYASQTINTCESTTRLNVAVTINALPSTPAAIGGTKTVCVGKTTTLTEATSGGVWSSSSTAIATISATGVVTGVAAGSATITYKVTNASGCSRSVTTTVTVSAVPAQPGNFTTSTSAISRGTTSYTYTVPLASGVTYKWSYSGTGATITGTTNTVRVVFSTTATLGSLSVTASNTSGCTSAARTLAITFLKSADIPADIQAAVEIPVSKSDLTVAKSELKVYPNPTSGQATFEFGITENARVTLDVYSITGQHIARIFDASMDSGIRQKVLFDQALSTGTYPCIMRWNGQMITVKLVITQ